MNQKDACLLALDRAKLFENSGHRTRFKELMDCSKIESRKIERNRANKRIRLNLNHYFSSWFISYHIK